MTFFKKTNIFNDIECHINSYAKTNGYGLLIKAKHWSLFEKDELKAQIKFVEIKGKKKLELIVPLFEEISPSLEILIRPICGEKCIRDIVKKDIISKCGNKINLFRYLNVAGNSTKNKFIEKNINSMFRKSKELQEEIVSLLDYLMFIKLN